MSTSLSIARNTLGGINRPPGNPVCFTTAPGAKLRLEIHDDKAAAEGVAFIDCDFNGDMQWRGDGYRHILFEGCRMWLDFQGKRNSDGSAGASAHNLQIRRCTIADHWGAGARMQGTYLWNIDGVLMQDTFLHHNGWKPGAARSLPLDQGGGSIHNHNAYINQPCKNVVVHQCVTSAPSSHGIHLKCGGLIQDCLAVDCPIGFQPAYGGDGYFGMYGLVASTMRGCVAIGSDDINTSNGNLRGNFAWLTCLKSGMIEDNVAIANTTSPANDAVFWVDRKSSPAGSFTLRNNRAYGWRGGIFISPGTVTPQITESNNQLDLAMNSRLDALLQDVRAKNYSAQAWNGGKPGVSRTMLKDVLTASRA
jgi:hypothetical protein